MTEQAAFFRFLEGEGYLHPRVVQNDFYAAVRPFAFTHAIIIAELGDRTGYLDRWCYRTYAKALVALLAWDGSGEPHGWHRHPASGRRVCYEEGTRDDQGRAVPIGEMYHYA